MTKKKTKRKKKDCLPKSMQVIGYKANRMYGIEKGLVVFGFVLM